MDAKGKQLELSTFQNFGKSEITGYKKVDKNSKTFIDFIWYKLCAKHKEAILAYPALIELNLLLHEFEWLLMKPVKGY